MANQQMGQTQRQVNITEFIGQQSMRIYALEQQLQEVSMELDNKTRQLDAEIAKNTPAKAPAGPPTDEILPCPGGSPFVFHDQEMLELRKAA